MERTHKELKVNLINSNRYNDGEKVEIIDMEVNKKYKRKLTHVTGNFYKFTLNKETYHVLMNGCIDPEFIVFKYQNVERDVYWNGFSRIFNELIEKYKYLETEDGGIPSGPDTSKFISVRKGDLSWEKDYWTTCYYSRVGYSYIFKIGSGISKDKTMDLRNDLLSIYLNASKNKLTLDGREIRIGFVYGSAWTGIGIR